MAHLTRVTAELDAEATRINTALGATPAPSAYEQYMMRRTLDIVVKMRIASGETETDHILRLNTIIQQSPAGYWSTSFWAGIASAIAADTATGPRGGVGRGDS
jgi:hypothetical protein